MGSRTTNQALLRPRTGALRCRLSYLPLSNCGTLDISRSIVTTVGTVNLNGGTITASRVGTATANQVATITGSTAAFNFNGGTLRASASSTTFLVNTARTNIVAAVVGNQLQISWPSDHTGWRLQAQTNSLSVGISTNWVSVPGSASTNSISLPLNPANPAVFLRLVYP